MLPGKQTLLHHAIVMIAGGAAVALLILSCFGDRGSGAPVWWAPADAAMRASAAPTVAREEQREAVPTGGCMVRVLSEEGPPLAGVSLFDARECRLPPNSGMAPLAVSDGAGHIRIDADMLSRTARFVLWSVGYSPVVPPALRIGRSLDVRMPRAFGTSIRVRYGSGVPVAGYRIALSRADPAVSGIEGGVAASPLRARPAAEGGAHFAAVSDAAGLIQVEGLGRGRYFLRCNLGGMAVNSAKAPIFLDLPGPPQAVVVAEYHAMVVRYLGDEVVVASHTGLGRHGVFKNPGSALEREVVAATTRALEQRFPGARVFVGAPRNRGEGDLRTRLAVFGRRSGRFVHDVAVRPVSQIRAPDEVSLPTGAVERTGSLRVVPEDPSGKPLAADGGRVAIVCAVEGFTTRIFADCNAPVVVPEGNWSLSPAGEFPRDAFETRQIQVTAGMGSRIEWNGVGTASASSVRTDSSSRTTDSATESRTHRAGTERTTIHVEARVNGPTAD